MAVRAEKSGGKKKEEAIVALLTSRNVEEAAHLASVPARTLYRWLNERDFGAAYRRAQRAAFSQSTARIHQMASAAVTTLGKIMVDTAAPPASRVRAAGRILDHGARAIEIDDIEARISELERAAELSKQGR